METVTDRISRYLLRRIRRRAVLDLYESAAVVELLTSRFVDGSEDSGTAWSITRAAMALLTGDPAKDRAAVARALQRARPIAPSDETEMYDFSSQAEHPVIRELQDICDGEPSTAGASDEAGLADRERRLATIRLLTLLREHLPRPNAVQVAVALLVARAVGNSVDDVQALVKVLCRSSPFLSISVPVSQFERRFGMQLEEGLIIPSRCVLSDVMKGPGISGRYNEKWRSRPHRKIATLSGQEARKANELSLRRYIADVLLAADRPLVIADEAPGTALPLVARTPDLALAGQPIDRELIAELLLVCLAIAPKRSLKVMEGMKLDPTGLGLDDLALAVRPGRHVAEVIRLLGELAERNRGSVKEEDGEESWTEGLSSTGRSGAAGKGKAGALAGEVIEPEPLEVTEAEGQGTGKRLKPRPLRRPLRVEKLAGYGEARQWALDLKEDLDLWREGQLNWPEMSTKLLLSGPPGTGKTTFARALCNTLQVPLVATSVATWLEPGYLGDVLKCITATFAAASGKAPCILFIDELDNIGSRGRNTGKHYDDYWTSLINRLLELLDGAAKTEGVIVVGATNLPGNIDPALLRSGRLEKHVVIPPPDTDAMVGILVHHLGDDLAAILKSAPAAPSPRNAEKLADTLPNPIPTTPVTGSIAEQRSCPAEWCSWVI
ncbi:AAA family ATPase, partial [Pseudorhizobium flavum]